MEARAAAAGTLPPLLASRARCLLCCRWLPPLSQRLPIYSLSSPPLLLGFYLFTPGTIGGHVSPFRSSKFGGTLRWPCDGPVASRRLGASPFLRVGSGAAVCPPHTATGVGNGLPACPTAPPARATALNSFLLLIRKVRRRAFVSSIAAAAEAGHSAENIALNPCFHSRGAQSPIRSAVCSVRSCIVHSATSARA